ncbi:hypothetical protein EK904_002177, partial [Melospiza melodia maxima]
MWQFDLSNVRLSESLYAPDSSFDFSAVTHISPKQVKKYLRSDGIIIFHWSFSHLNHNDRKNLFCQNAQSVSRNQTRVFNPMWAGNTWNNSVLKGTFAILHVLKAQTADLYVNKCYKMN